MLCCILDVLFMWVHLYVCIAANGMVKRGIINSAFEDINENSHVIGEIVSDGVINCMMLCFDSDDCRSVSHHKLDNRCRLFYQDFTRQTPTGSNEMGWIHLDLTLDCVGIQSQGHTSSGLYTITIAGNQVQVWCDLETEGGGWTVFQRRSDGSVDFHRDWNDYVRGFGDPSSEYWIGNDALSTLTNSGTNELLILMETWDRVLWHARYVNFRVNNGTDKYRLYVEGYSGTAGNSLGYISGQQFSTRDQDNDAWVGPCNPNYHSGGWWYKDCTFSDLNGLYYNSSEIVSNSCHWYSIEGNRRSLRTVFMMTRKN